MALPEAQCGKCRRNRGPPGAVGTARLLLLAESRDRPGGIVPEPDADGELDSLRQAVGFGAQTHCVWRPQRLP